MIFDNQPRATGRRYLEGKVLTYNDLGKLLLGLSTSTKFKDVQLLSVVPSIGVVNAYQFSLNLNVNPEIFYKK